ncbi:MAG: ABC transporter permease [Gammaproteobacteria bacterium]|nr:ABC transporter permease [Gammaproteobacteria bacterium]MBU2428633.1 ABC transporter permease [Gammaproteobacteria bacterium]
MIFHYLMRRMFLLSFVFVALTIFAFSLGYLFPGDVLSNFTGLRNISPANEIVLRQQLGLDQGYWQQYIYFNQRILDGNWALSFSSQQNVLDEILNVMPATLELASYALLLSLLIGVPFGIIAAVRKDKWLDKLISGFALVGYSIPTFWWALLLIMVFSLTLGWLPTSGRLSVLYEIPRLSGFMLPDILGSDAPYRNEALFDAIRHLLLPSLVLATYPTTVMIRFTRESMLDVLEQNYIKTARAKGLTRLQVLYKHGLRNALLPVTRQVGLQFSTLITLAMITEVIFSWPGIGRWLIDSIYQRNFPAIQGGVLVVSSLVIAVNMFTEILHTLLNPLARK